MGGPPAAPHPHGPSSAGPFRWHVNVDRHLNPLLPASILPRLPHPVAHFLGYRSHPSAVGRVGNLIVVFWAAIGIFSSLAIIGAVSQQVPEFTRRGVPVIVGSFVSFASVPTFPGLFGWRKKKKGKKTSQLGMALMQNHFLAGRCRCSRLLRHRIAARAAPQRRAGTVDLGYHRRRYRKAFSAQPAFWECSLARRLPSMFPRDSRNGVDGHGASTCRRYGVDGGFGR